MSKPERMHIRDRMTKEQYEDLYNRRVTVRDMAKTLGVTENYLSHAVPERAPKRNPKLLRATRRLFQEQLAREVIEGKHTVYAGAEIAHVSERTMYRRIEDVRAKIEAEKRDGR